MFEWALPINMYDYTLCYETILSGRVIYARCRCNAGALSVYLTHILLTSRQLFFDTKRDNIHCSTYLCFTDRDTCYD